MTVQSGFTSAFLIMMQEKLVTSAPCSGSTVSQAAETAVSWAGLLAKLDLR